jgi:hypothetical protein
LRYALHVAAYNLKGNIVNKSAVNNLLRIAFALRAATLAARERTKDRSLGVSGDGGRFRVVRVTYRANGLANVEPRTDYMTAQQAVDFLNSL